MGVPGEPGRWTQPPESRMTTTESKPKSPPRAAVEAPRRIAIYGGSFNPPGSHHREIAEALAHEFDEVVIVPCGPRPDKPVTNDVEPIFRAAMVDMTFQGLPGVRVELFDLESSTFTRTHELDRMFSSRGEVWHVVGADLIKRGSKSGSFIHREWEQGERLWKQARFAVLTRPGFTLDPDDLPPSHRVFEIRNEGSSSLIRERVFQHKPIEGMVLPRVERYIASHKLYRGTKPPRSTTLQLDEPRVMVIADPNNPMAMGIAAKFPELEPEDPNLIVVIGGDGTMLRSIREHWRLRLPFYGINAGHIGFLLNDRQRSDFTRHNLVVQQLPLLRVETVNAYGEHHSSLAFNDAWVERNSGQSAWIEVRVDGQVRVSRLVADGALVATAAGSGSYARAMGATPLPFDTPAIMLVGSNVLKPAFWKPVVLPMEVVIEFINLDASKRPLRAFLDGRPEDDVISMRVSVSNIAAVELAFDSDLNPAEKLAQIQFPPSDL
jgi:NAD+ kinase